MKVPYRVQLTLNIAGALLAGVFVLQAILSRDTSGYDLIEFLSGIGIFAAIVLAFGHAEQIDGNSRNQCDEDGYPKINKSGEHGCRQ